MRRNFQGSGAAGVLSTRLENIPEIKVCNSTLELERNGMSGLGQHSGSLLNCCGLPSKWSPLNQHNKSYTHQGKGSFYIQFWI